jgi:CheY-like chemotaxis protein
MKDKFRNGVALVISKDPCVLLLLGSVLAKEGFRALFARSEKEAVEIAARPYVPIDVVLCDVVLCDVGGELLHRLRQIRPELCAVYVQALNDGGVIRIRMMRQAEPGQFVRAGGLMLGDAVRTALRSSSLRMGAS